MAYCIQCGAQLAEGAADCTSCGKAAPQSAGGGAAVAPSPDNASVSGLADNIAGTLAYVTFIPAIVFLLLEPYKTNRFVRFHALQCIFLFVVAFAADLVLIWIPVFRIPLLGMALSILVSLAVVGLWIVLMIKAYSGLMYKVPVVGDLAEKQANAL